MVALIFLCHIASSIALERRVAIFHVIMQAFWATEWGSFLIMSHSLWGILLGRVHADSETVWRLRPTNKIYQIFEIESH